MIQGSSGSESELRFLAGSGSGFKEYGSETLNNLVCLKVLFFALLLWVGSIASLLVGGTMKNSGQTTRTPTAGSPSQTETGPTGARSPANSSSQLCSHIKVISDQICFWHFLNTVSRDYFPFFKEFIPLSPMADT